ncbi:hypothetical protein K458DRAFT_282813, partial [Lentithecium fluviatile CBS 122367]
PLDDDASNIRLLDVDPLGWFEPVDAELKGKLRVVSLRNSPRYAALSYTWGNDGPSSAYTVQCSQRRIETTKNCVDALRRIRSRWKRTTIWVDSICINQQDVRERNHQVSLMKEIYIRAKRVYIWLGNGSRDTDRAIDFIKDV